MKLPAIFCFVSSDNKDNETIPNKKVYIYPIKDTDGTPLDLINVLTHVLSTGVSNAGAMSVS